MKRFLRIGIIALVAGFASANQPLQVVTTFSLLKDIVEQIGGERVNVHSMVPIGTDPHEYQPLPQDIIAATRADIIFWNGLNMETGDGWLEKLLNVAGKAFDTPQVVELAAGIEPLYLTEGNTDAVNPHAFISPKQGLVYAQNALAGLQRIDPDYADFYATNAETYLTELEEWHFRYERIMSLVPDEDRVLVTGERAFQYLANDYNILEGYLWEIDTDEQGTPQQIASLIAFVREHQPHGLLTESNVDPRPMRTVSSETGVPIMGEVYSDELGPEGSPGDTYFGYLNHNLGLFMHVMPTGE